MLLQNKSILACNGLRQLCGASTSVIGLPSGFGNSVGLSARSLLGGSISSKSNRFIGEATFYKGDGTPSGYTPTSGAWYPNRKTGGMASRYLIVGSGTIVKSTAALAGGVNIGSNMNTASGTIVTIFRMSCSDHFTVDQASLTSLGEIKNTSSLQGGVKLLATLISAGTIPDVQLKILAWCETVFGFGGTSSVTGALQAPLALSTTLTGGGSVSYAALVGLVHLLSNLDGSGNLTPDLKFPANLISSVSASGRIEDTLLKATAWCVTDILGNGSVAGSDLKGKGNLEALITSQGEVLTAQSCAIAVWEELAAAHLKDGTTGKALASAGSAGDPWSSIMAAYTDDATFGAYVKKLLTTGKFIGLK